MKLLTKEEQAELVPVSKAYSNKGFRKQAFAMNVGEVLFLSNTEWKKMKYSKKTTIGSIVWHPEMKFSAKKNQFRKTKGYAVKRLA